MGSNNAQLLPTSVPVSVLLPGLAYSIAPLKVKVNSGILHLYCKPLYVFDGRLLMPTIIPAFSWLFGILTYVFAFLNIQ